MVERASVDRLEWSIFHIFQKYADHIPSYNILTYNIRCSFSKKIRETLITLVHAGGASLFAAERRAPASLGNRKDFLAMPTPRFPSRSYLSEALETQLVLHEVSHS